MRMHERYDGIAIALHWSTAAMILYLIASGLAFANGFEGRMKNPLYATHKAAGLLVLVITVLRLGRRLARGAPPLPGLVPVWLRRLAGLWHAALYATLLLMPVTGYLYVVGGGYPVEALNALGLPPLLEKNPALSKTAEGVHRWLAWIFILLIGGHVGAVIWHDGVRRDGVFRRMAPLRRRGARI